MAKNNEAKVRFTAEASDLNKAIASSNSELTKLRSELRLNETQAKSTGDSLDNLKDRQRILGDEFQASQTKIDALSDKLEAARSIFGENSTEVQKLETQLNNARTAQERIAQQIDQTNAAMADMESASSQAESALGKLGSEVESQESTLRQLKDRYNEVAAEQGASSTEARQLATQISKTSSELQDNRSKLQQASTAADQFDKSLDGVGDSARDAGNDLGTMDIALGDFISDTAQSGIESLLGLEESTRQYRNEQNKLEAVATQSGQSIDALQQGFETLYAVSGDETLASTATLNMSAMGVSVDDQMAIVNAATGAWAAYGDSIPLDGLLESINETTRAGTVTGSFADALNWAAMSNEQWSAALSGNSAAQAAFNKGVADGMTVEDAFNEALAACATTQERQQLVTAAMDAAYGDLGATYADTNEEVEAANRATLAMTDAQAALGEAVAPIQTYFTNLIASGLQWLADNLPIVVPLVVGLATAFAGFAVVNTVLPAIQGVMTSLSAAPTILAAIGGPATIVIGVVAALAAGFVYLWNTSETFRNGVMAVWGTIQAVFGTLAEWFMTNVVTPVVTYFTGLSTQLQSIWSGISQIVNIAITAVSGFISSNMSTIQAIWSSIWGVISAVAGTIWANIQNTINTVLGVIQGIINVVLSAISGDWSGVLNGLSDIAESIFNGIANFISNTINGIASVIGSVLSGISSTVSGILGNIAGFFSDKFGAIGDTVSSVIDTAKNVVSGGLDAIAGFFSGLHIEFPHISLPHFSISGSFSLMPPSVPSIGIEWYAQGGILNGPTIFGQNGSDLMVGGEAGKEVVAPLGDLLGYMIEALDSRLAQSDGGALIDAIEALASRPVVVSVNGRELALATASDTDRVSGSRQNLVRRGVSLA